MFVNIMNNWLFSKAHCHLLYAFPDSSGNIQLIYVEAITP
uniref:Uncharacterized protein n=1 Tax=Rhizophora mucronata TaxID=61149 RepID=A0A2P2J2A6_RHIMU